MTEQAILIALSALGLAALASQWLAWRLRLPAILFLLLTGILVGPILGWLDPSRLFGDLLFPLVSLSVALILSKAASRFGYRNCPESVASCAALSASAP